LLAIWPVEIISIPPLQKGELFMLSELEHSILGTVTLGPETMAEWEGIQIIYKLARYSFPGVKFADVVEALVKLLDMSYVECQLEEYFSKPIFKITKDEILNHYGGDLTEEDINVYPKEAVYAFRATKKGREEYKKDLYDVYYPEES